MGLFAKVSSDDFSGYADLFLNKAYYKVLRSNCGSRCLKLYSACVSVYASINDFIVDPFSFSGGDADIYSIFNFSVAHEGLTAFDDFVDLDLGYKSVFDLFSDFFDELDSWVQDVDDLVDLIPGGLDVEDLDSLLRDYARSL